MTQVSGDPQLRADLCQVKIPQLTRHFHWTQLFVGFICWELASTSWRDGKGDPENPRSSWSTGEKCTEVSLPISFTICTKFIRLRVKTQSTLQGAVCVARTNVGKSEESQRHRGQGQSVPRGPSGENKSGLTKNVHQPNPTLWGLRTNQASGTFWVTVPSSVK